MARRNRGELSPREADILQDIANGLSTKEIAAKYLIAISTVTNHRSHIISKLNVSNTAEAVAKNMRFGKLV